MSGVCAATGCWLSGGADLLVSCPRRVQLRACCSRAWPCHSVHFLSTAASQMTAAEGTRPLRGPRIPSDLEILPGILAHKQGLHRRWRKEAPGYLNPQG